MNIIPRTLRPAAIVTICIFFAPILRAGTKVSKTNWGKDAKGTEVTLYTLTSGNAEVKVATYGARIVSVRVPDRDGKQGNVIVGRDTLEGYMDDRTSVMGATIGRYANRIAGGEFKLGGTTYQIPKNNSGNALHGGTVGFDRKVWLAKGVKNGVEMTFVSPDGDMGFPGTLTVHVTFTLTQQHGRAALGISYFAETDKTTVVNFTNHAYFNLANDPSTSVFDDTAIIDADNYTPVDDRSVPTGKVEPVAGTPYDFRIMRTIGSLAPPRGYDINFVFHPRKNEQAAAEVDDPASGRTIQVFTTEPGMQFFVPRFPAPPPNATGGSRPVLAAFCLETQHFPDSPNQPSFPSTELRPGKPFQSTTTYVFGVKPAQAK